MSKHKGFFKESEIEKISSKLKFISKIDPGQKISVNSNYIQNNTYFTSVVRYLTGENREKVYNYICDVVQDSFSVLDSLSDSSNDYDIKICRNLIGDLLELKPGLQNLKQTYSRDKNYVSKMETLGQNLDVKIEELCNKKDISLSQIIADKEELKKKEALELELEAKKVKSIDTEEKKVNETKDKKSEQPEKKKIMTTKKKKIITPEPEADGATGSSDDTEEIKKKKKSYVEVAKAKNKARRNRNDTNTNKKNTYQYESYYLSNPDDLYNYPADLDAGIIKKHT
jgi:hypothetical protein